MSVWPSVAAALAGRRANVAAKNGVPAVQVLRTIASKYYPSSNTNDPFLFQMDLAKDGAREQGLRPIK